jgi:hypothetical protein
MIKLIPDITRNIYSIKESLKEAHKSHYEFHVNKCLNTGTFYAKSREKYMEFEGKITRKFKEKHGKFFYSGG